MSEALRISIWASRPPVSVWRNAVRARDVPIGCPYDTVTVARRRGAAASVRHCWRKRGECSSIHFTIGCSPVFELDRVGQRERWRVARA